MKKILQVLMISVSLLLIIMACSNFDSGDKFLGQWGDSQQFRRIIITKAGETAYTIRFSEHNMVVFTATATYEKGNLVSGGFGSAIISYSNGKIISDGVEYIKI